MNAHSQSGFSDKIATANVAELPLPAGNEPGKAYYRTQYRAYQRWLKKRANPRRATERVAPPQPVSEQTVEDIKYNGVKAQPGNTLLDTLVRQHAKRTFCPPRPRRKPKVIAEVCEYTDWWLQVLRGRVFVTSSDDDFAGYLLNLHEDKGLVLAIIRELLPRDAFSTWKKMEYGDKNRFHFPKPRRRRPSSAAMQVKGYGISEKSKRRENRGKGRNETDPLRIRAEKVAAEKLEKKLAERHADPAFESDINPERNLAALKAASLAEIRA